MLTATWPVATTLPEVAPRTCEIMARQHRTGRRGAEQRRHDTAMEDASVRAERIGIRQEQLIWESIADCLPDEIALVHGGARRT
jgi:hypothetical protein